LPVAYLDQETKPGLKLAPICPHSFERPQAISQWILSVTRNGSRKQGWMRIREGNPEGADWHSSSGSKDELAEPFSLLSYELRLQGKRST